MAEGKILRELYLIRHGQSRGNAGLDPADEFDSHDPVLSETGRLQAQVLGKYCAENLPFDFVYSSGLRRAVETAGAIVSSSEKINGLFILPDLCETGVGIDYDGLTIDDLKLLCPEAAVAEGYENAEKLIINDECPSEKEERYFERAKRVLDYVAQRYNDGEKIALTAHAAFLTYIIFYIIGYRDKEPNYDFSLTNTGITKITFYAPGTHEFGDTVFEYINSTPHLQKQFCEHEKEK